MNRQEAIEQFIFGKIPMCGFGETHTRSTMQSWRGLSDDQVRALLHNAMQIGLVVICEGKDGAFLSPPTRMAAEFRRQQN